MASLTIEGDELVVGLSPAEALLALHRGVRVPLSAVRSVAVEPHPWRAARGIRVGTSVPGVLFFGTRRHAGGKDFGAHRGRAPVVRVDLDETSPTLAC